MTNAGVIIPAIVIDRGLVLASEFFPGLFFTGKFYIAVIDCVTEQKQESN
jgi:hypothetical protein